MVSGNFIVLLLQEELLNKDSENSDQAISRITLVLDKEIGTLKVKISIDVHICRAVSTHMK